MNAKLQIKMDFSDIIFYIVFAIIGIFSTVAQNKGKKKTETARRPMPENKTYDESNQPSPYAEYTEKETIEQDDSAIDNSDENTPIHSLEDIFRALREGTPLVIEKTPQKPFEDKSSYDTINEQNNTTPQPTTPTFVEGESAINDISGNEISDNTIYDGVNSDENFNPQTIDWQQAVITSEILNRKY